MTGEQPAPVGYVCGVSDLKKEHNPIIEITIG